MGYAVKKIVLYKEDEFNVKPSNPKAFEITTSSFDLKAEKETKKIEPLGNGHEPSFDAEGDFNYSGGVGFYLGADNLPFLVDGVIGGASKITNAVSTKWKATTVQKKGDMVNHSDGKHTLVCYKGGTTGATEPVVTGKENRAQITDGTTVWFLRPLLKKREGTLQHCMTSWGIEREDIASCGMADEHFELFTGAIMTSLEFKKDGTEITFDISQDLIAGGHQDTFSDTSYSKLTNTIKLERAEFNKDNLIIEVSEDGVTWEVPEYADSINLSIQADREMKKVLTGKRPEFKKKSISGNLKGLMRKDTYLKSYENKIFKFRFTYFNTFGDKSTIEFSKVKFLNSKNNIQVGEDITLDIPLSGAGTNEESSIKYTCITDIDF